MKGLDLTKILIGVLTVIAGIWGYNQFIAPKPDEEE